jgi:hypothetical protein
MVTPCSAPCAPISARGDVGLLVTDHLLAGRDQQPDAEQVGQRPGGGEQPGLVPEQQRDALLQRPDGRVLAVYVVADRAAAMAARMPGVGW